MNSAPRPASTPSLTRVLGGFRRGRRRRCRCRRVGRPRAPAFRFDAHALTPETTRSIAPRSRRSRTSVKPAAVSNAAVAGAWPAPISSASAPPARSSPGAAATSRRTSDQAVGAAVERQQRLGAHLGGEAGDVGAGDVGQVGGDDVERRVRAQRRVEVPLDEGDGDAVSLGVRRARPRARPATDRWRRPRASDRLRSGLRDRDRHRARAGADVGERARARGGSPQAPRRVADGGQPRQRLVDQRLGVGARHQHARVDVELDAEELLLADDVRHRLARLAALDQLAHAGELGGLERAIELHVELHAADAERVRRQHLGVEARRRETALREARRRPAQHLEHGPARGRRRGRRRDRPIRAGTEVPRFEAAIVATKGSRGFGDPLQPDVRASSRPSRARRRARPACGCSSGSSTSICSMRGPVGAAYLRPRSR